MAMHAALSPPSRAVEATLTYCVRTGEKPVSGSTGPGGRLYYRSGTYEDRTVTIHDVRPLADRLSLDVEGFRLVRHETRMTDFYDDDELRAVFYPEIERLVMAETGATRVLVFDHTRRAGDEATREARRVREPVKIVHNDYTEWSGPQRVRDLLPAAEAAALLEHRVAVVQVWRATRGPILSNPLAICDAQSLAPGDLIAAERRHPDRIGEIYQIAYNPAHRWYYVPEMTRSEALVFKCYDSMKDGRARFTAHASFDDPTTPAGAPPRESIEMRTLAFFAPDAGSRGA
ncbi:MAG TPA: CmcJ/NvfI family oxidoreductase [Alphaproteobacteria bacterium]